MLLPINNHWSRVAVQVHHSGFVLFGGVSCLNLDAHFLDLCRLFFELRREDLDFLSLLSDSGLEIFALLCDARFLFRDRGF